VQAFAIKTLGENRESTVAFGSSKAPAFADDHPALLVKSQAVCQVATVPDNMEGILRQAVDPLFANITEI
jgi:hypothetical protein